MFYERFKDFYEIDDIIKKSPNNNKYYIDTVLINKVILKRRGLTCENIIDTGICTACNVDKMHSYRKERKSCGRNLSLMTIL